MSTPIKWESEFLVNSITAGNQFQPTVTALADGRFVAVWSDTSGTLGDNSSLAVHAQIFAADGSRIGSEFLVNSGTALDQYSPSVTALSDGGFVISFIYQDGGSQTMMRMFKPDGTPAGLDQLVHNGAIPGSIIALSNDRFVVTWSSVGDDNIHAQLYLPDGTKLFNEFTVNSVTAGAQFNPSAAALPNGRFVVTWTSHDGGVDRLHGQLFDNSGGHIGNEFLVSPQGSDQDFSQVTALHNGGFAVTWEHLNGDGTLDIHARAFNANGASVGGEFLVNSTTAGDQFKPAIAALNDGRFVVAWADGDVHAQVFNSDGSKSGAEFVVNAEPGMSADPAITVLPDGRFVVTWPDGAPNADGSGLAVHAQIFDPREGGVSLSGTALNDDLIGTEFNDTIKGAGGADHLHGMGGDDFLIGGAGADTLSGGTGSDTASYADSPSGVKIDLASNINTGGDAQGDVLYSVENLVGSKYSDVLSGNNADNMFEGGAGADTLIGGTGIDTASYQHSPSGVNVNLSTGLGSGGDAQGDNLDITIENLIGSNYNDVLTGSNFGNNVIEGGLGDDIIDGKNGDDTAVFSHNFNDYVVTDYGAKILVEGPDGTDVLTSIEHLRFADATITPANFADGNPLFDPLYYLSRNGDVFHAGVNPLAHFNANGWHEGRDPNPFFDTSAYLSAYKDAAASGMNPLDHYDQIGWKQGYDPAANFDTKLYLVHNPDVAAAGLDPLAHFLQSGWAEGRQAYQAIGTAVNGFDAEYYLMHNQDVAAAGIDPLAHFLSFGWHEGRNPNAWFDTNGYLAHYGDVAAAGINPLTHYEQSGWLEGRDPSSTFDTLQYLAANADVAAAHINPLDHFINSGIYEGRVAFNDGAFH